MDGAELTTQEFAFLLSSVGATSVVDLEDPDLFPRTEEQQRKTFEQGLEQLVENGWVETDSQDPAEAGLNATLFQLVAVISAPEAVISTSMRASGDSPARLMHYIGAGLIVELDAPAESRYRIGVISGFDQLASRLSQFLGVAGSGNGALLELDREQASRLNKMAAGGNTDAASAGFAGAGLPENQAATLAQALAQGAIADIVGARAVGGEIGETVRATVFGDESSAWLAFYSDPDSDQLSLAAANGANIQSMLETWIGEFGLQVQDA